ncbi:MAG: rhodanese-like domain-containing protein [Thermodesulfobacteriota bacterium]
MPAQYTDLSPVQARAFMAAHGQDAFTLLDVRQDWEYEETHIPGARHVPLPELSDRAGELDPSKPVLAYCRSGKRSSAAAGFLAGQGFARVLNLAGGISAWQGQTVSGGPDLGLDLFAGAAGPRDVVLRACCMERNLDRLYTALAGKARDRETGETLALLAGFERKHVALLLAIHRQATGEALGEEDFQRLALDQALEGGITAERFLEDNPDLLASPRTALEAGMAVEAHALDLYARLAATSPDQEAGKLLLRLADEEKAHLKALGALLDRLGDA